MHTGESERLCQPRPGEDMEDYYKRAEEFHNLVGNAAEEARVIWLGKALRMNRRGYWIPRSAEYVIEKVRNAKKMAMTYSCERAFDILSNACDLHGEVLEPEELERYKLIGKEEGAWMSKADWSTDLIEREKEIKNNNWKGGLPSPIKNNLKEIRAHQEKEMKKADAEKKKRRELFDQFYNNYWNQS